MSEQNKNQVEEMEMEMELDGEEITAEMEEIVSEKEKAEEKKNKEQKHKRGPKPKTEEEKAKNKEDKPKEKQEKKLNLKDINTIQREIKKGRLSAPCYRIEKVEGENGISYDLLRAYGVIFSKDAVGNYKKYDNIQKMNDGKSLVTIDASKQLNTEKFKAKHENGEEVEHDYVRYELSKPGRDKDVIQLMRVSEAKANIKRLEAVETKKKEDAKKKEEKELAKKQEQEQENKVEAQ